MDVYARVAFHVLCVGVPLCVGSMAIRLRNHRSLSYLRPQPGKAGKRDFGFWIADCGLEESLRSVFSINIDGIP